MPEINLEFLGRQMQRVLTEMKIFRAAQDGTERRTLRIQDGIGSIKTDMLTLRNEIASLRTDMDSGFARLESLLKPPEDVE